MVDKLDWDHLAKMGKLRETMEEVSQGLDELAADRDARWYRNPLAYGIPLIIVFVGASVPSSASKRRGTERRPKPGRGNRKARPISERGEDR